MFGFGQGGMFAGPSFGGVSNAFAAPTPGGPQGQGSAYGALGGLGQYLMQQSQPRFAGQAAPNISQGFGGLFPGRQFDPSQIPQRMGQAGGGFPPWLLQMLQQRMQQPVGQASQGPNVYGPIGQTSPQWLAPGGYR